MYEVFAHTADLGLRVKAPDLNALFSEAGQGLFSVIVSNLGDVRPQSSVEFHIEGRNLEYLFADWLSELLYAFESRRMLLRNFDVSVDNYGLRATASGETVNEQRHQLDHEIKAITYHGLSIRQTNGSWVAEVILDI